MNTPSLTGGVLGLAAGTGLLLTLARLPAYRRPTLADRLAPYLRDAARPSRLLDAPATRTPWPAMERLLGPLLVDAARALERVLGGSASVRRRLGQLGRGTTVEAFRVEQVVWGGLGLLAGLLLALALSARAGGPRGPLLLALVLLGGAAGVVARDQQLSRAVAARERRLLAEFPTVAELLALAVGAGEGAAAALERVARVSRGELSLELARAVADARAGASLAQALQALADRTSLASLARFADGVAVAIERGTPLGEVLRAQAADVREEGKRALLEAGGRKELAMLVPVVFLVLPITVVFALYPGFLGLTLTSP